LKSFQTNQANVDLFSFLFKDDNFDEKKIPQTAKPRIFPDLKWQKRKNDPHIDYGRQKLDFALKISSKQNPLCEACRKKTKKIQNLPPPLPIY